MKKIILILLLLVAFRKTNTAQITLDNIYPGAIARLYMVNLEVSGPKYIIVTYEQGNRYIKLYNLNHSLWKTVDCNPMPTSLLPPGNLFYGFDVLYVTENLFDCDNDVEFMYVSDTGIDSFTGIYNENGTPLLLADSTVPLVKASVPQQWRPLYNTPAGTKLILSHRDGSARIYKIDCSYVGTGTEPLMQPLEAPLMEVFPNPSFYESTIRYKLPADISGADIAITDLSGREIKHFQVDHNFSSLLIAQNEMAAGTYIYSLKVNGQVLESKKIILSR